MRSILAKSLLIDFLLTSIRLSHGDDARHDAATRRVSNDDYSTGEQAQGGKPFLSIIEAIIHEGHARVAEHLFGVGKVQAVLDEVAAVLCFVPCVVTNKGNGGCRRSHNMGRSASWLEADRLCGHVEDYRD